MKSILVILSVMAMAACAGPSTDDTSLSGSATSGSKAGTKAPPDATAKMGSKASGTLSSGKKHRTQ